MKGFLRTPKGGVVLLVLIAFACGWFGSLAFEAIVAGNAADATIAISTAYFLAVMCARIGGDIAKHGRIIVDDG